MVLRMARPTTDRNGTYYTRKVVPPHLRSIVGKTALKKSLRTKLSSEAKTRHPIALNELELEICKAQQVYDSSSVVNELLIQQSVFQWKQKMVQSIQFDMGLRDRFISIKEGRLESNYEPLDDYLDSPLNEAEEAKAKRVGLLAGMLTTELGEVSSIGGFEMHHSQSIYALFVESTATAVIGVISALEKTYSFQAAMVSHGLKPEDLSNTSSESTITQPLTFIRLFDEYSASVRRRVPERAEKRLRDYSGAVKRFIRYIGDKPVNAISKRDMAAYRELLEQLPKKPKAKIEALSLQEQVAAVKEQSLPTVSLQSVKKQLQCISAVFTFAVDRDDISNNPVHGVTRDIKKSVGGASDKGYTKEQIDSLFKSELFTVAGGTEHPIYGKALYWIPLILRYTGARAEEIAQLYIADVRVNDDIPYIEISAKREDQTTKSGISRKVPLHPDLLELGLKEYVDSLPKTGRLFPKLRKTATGYHGSLGKAFGKYVREGVKLSVDKPLHGFRHAFITACRENEVRIDIQKAITGHADYDVASAYGQIPLKIRALAVKRALT